VMRNYGNLSGSSNLVVLDHNRRREINPVQRSFSLCLSFGPGVGMEALLL
jgi:predicted naringenin-chalcone synthase